MPKTPKIINIDFSIKSNATAEEFERYEAVIILFSAFLFQNIIGGWEGKETTLKTDNYVRTNFWFVLASDNAKAVNELMRMVSNFKLKKVTKVKVGKAENSDMHLKKALKFSRNQEFVGR